MRIKPMLLTFSIILTILACSEGTIPTAVEPLVELQATYITTRPVVDGVMDEAVWDQASSYLVHIGQRDPRTGQIIGGYNVQMKALWWRDWGFGQTWAEQPYVAIALTWPDDDYNILKNGWHYHPADSIWTRDNNGSDWFLINWFSFSSISDLWYWDAALTNPVGYLEDQYIEDFQINDSTEVSQFNIDGLRFLNDISDQNNCWDLNYNDNMTPRDSTDDYPMKVWRANPNEVLPTLPRIYSEDSDRRVLLLHQDAEFMPSAFQTPYAELNDSITVPGYILQDPLNSSADIIAAGKYSNGFWTVELVRACKTSDENDVVFNPESRYSNYYFYLFIGDNSHAPLQRNISQEVKRQLVSDVQPVSLTFEFVDIHQPNK